MAAGAFDFLRGLMGWWHGTTGTPTLGNMCLAVMDSPVFVICVSHSEILGMSVQDTAVLGITTSDEGCV